MKAGDEVKCYFCAELIKREARICRHCGKPNHPVYHGPWLKISEIYPDGTLAKTNAKVGDAVYKYNGVEPRGDSELFNAEVENNEGPAVLTLVRDGEEMELNLPSGKIGLSMLPENKLTQDANYY